MYDTVVATNGNVTFTLGAPQQQFGTAPPANVTVSPSNAAVFWGNTTNGGSITALNGNNRILVGTGKSVTFWENFLGASAITLFGNTRISCQ